MKFTYKDIGSKVRLRSAHGLGSDATIRAMGINADGEQWIYVHVHDGSFSVGLRLMAHEVERLSKFTEADIGAEVETAHKDCPECQGTGIIKLFTSTEPCSICKTTKKSSVS